MVCSMSLAAGLFIWFKLRVVTGMPRSAYADPDQKQLDVPPQKATESAVATKPVEPRWAPDMDVNSEPAGKSGISPVEPNRDQR